MLPPYSPVWTRFSRVPARIVAEVTFNTPRQRYEFVDRKGTDIDLSYVIYHNNDNKCCFFTGTSELKSASPSTFPFPLIINLGYVKTDVYIFQSQIWKILKKRAFHLEVK